MSELYEMAEMTAIIIASIIALLTYIRSQRIQRIQVLLNLHKRFIETERYSLIRMKIERSDCKLLKMVEYVAKHPNSTFDPESLGNQTILKFLDPELMIKFDEYLGFFELLSHLRKMNYFEIEDIKGIFGYYILRFEKIPEVHLYLQQEVFEFQSLVEFIDDVANLKSEHNSG